MWLRSLLRRGILDTPLEPVVRALYTAVAPTQAARYDRQLNAVIRRLLRPGANSVDVGAHRGAVLRELMRRAPGGTHVAIEPLPEQAAFLRARFPTAHVLAYALSDRAGEATFYHVVGRPTRSGLRRVAYPSPDETVVPIRVPLARLDDLLPPELPIDLIKIDVEGAEHGVLAGAAGVIARHRPVIVFEHGLFSPRYYGVPSAQIYELLTKQYGLRVSTMARWLAGEPPLTEAAFVEEVSERGGYYFIAEGR
jgi:FkbM family methyltransferase